jgi:hypothetical protein
MSAPSPKIAKAYAYSNRVSASTGFTQVACGCALGGPRIGRLSPQRVMRIRCLVLLAVLFFFPAITGFYKEHFAGPKGLDMGGEDTPSIVEGAVGAVASGGGAEGAEGVVGAGAGGEDVATGEKGGEGEGEGGVGDADGAAAGGGGGDLAVWASDAVEGTTTASDATPPAAAGGGGGGAASDPNAFGGVGSGAGGIPTQDAQQQQQQLAAEASATGRVNNVEDVLSDDASVDALYQKLTVGPLYKL